MTTRPSAPARRAIPGACARTHRACDERAFERLSLARERHRIGARMAHELKNPLTGVKALVQLGLRDPAEKASHARLALVEREVTRMQEILQGYLSLARSLEEVAPVGVELGRLVSDALLALSARAEDARVRLRARGDARVEADPRRLREAILNLLANALEATPSGGEVGVEVRQVGDACEIVIRDSGPGMPAETLRRVGTPFFTTREDGTGLGVMLARAVIAQHGGTLRYESELGKGTAVRVTLPRPAATRGDGPEPAVRRVPVEPSAPGGPSSAAGPDVPPGGPVSLARGRGRSQ